MIKLLTKNPSCSKATTQNYKILTKSGNAIEINQLEYVNSSLKKKKTSESIIFGVIILN